MPEQLAVSLFDLDRLPHTLRAKLIQGKVELKPEPILGDAALVFCCPLLMAALTCDILRSNDRQLGDPPTRIYIKKQKWSRVGPHAIFTFKDLDGKAALSPAIFTVEEENVTLIPPQF